KAYKDRDYKFKNGRCKQAGLDHLDWAIGLTFGADYGINEDDPDYNKPTPQALSAMVIKELYLWWTETRPNRLDPHSLYDETNKVETFDKIDELETKYHQEDTDMMIKLITIRQDIWC
ncbi:hypothetical protein EBZ38_15200, partial [bacterium]|nr:hypothetical protein [bacterium]